MLGDKMLENQQSSFDQNSYNASYVDIRTLSGDEVSLPDVSWLTSATFHRQGPDLILESPSGERIFLIGYFDSASPMDLVGLGGANIPAHIVNVLSGSRTPGQFAQAVDTNSVEPIGQIETVEGGVFAVRVDGTRVSLKQGDPIFQGDTLETGEDGIIGVTFADESTLSLGQDGRMVIDEMVYDPGEEDGSASMFILQGAMSFVSGSIAKSNPDAMSINTPIATIGIRGTSILISSKPPIDGEPPQVAVAMLPEVGADGQEFVGEAIITTQGGSQVISGDFQGTTISDPAKPPSPPQTVSVNEIGRVFGNALSANPNKDSVPDGLRKAVEKVVEQKKAEEKQIEAEAKADQAKEQAEEKQAEAEAKSVEVAAAEAEAAALAEQAAEAQSAEEQTALEATASEAAAAAEALAAEQVALEQQAQEAEVLLQSVEAEVQQAEQEVQQAQSEAQDAVGSYADAVGDSSLASDTNLTGSNTPTTTGPTNEPKSGDDPTQETPAGDNGEGEPTGGQSTGEDPTGEPGGEEPIPTGEPTGEPLTSTVPPPQSTNTTTEPATNLASTLPPPPSGTTSTTTGTGSTTSATTGTGGDDPRNDPVQTQPDPVPPTVGVVTNVAAFNEDTSTTFYLSDVQGQTNGMVTHIGGHPVSAGVGFTGANDTGDTLDFNGS